MGECGEQERLLGATLTVLRQQSPEIAPSVCLSCRLDHLPRSFPPSSKGVLLQHGTVAEAELTILSHPHRVSCHAAEDLTHISG